MTPAQKSARARLAAHTRWANTEDRTAATAPARAAATNRYERQVDPEGLLDPGERRRRALHAQRAHMAVMSLRRRP